MELRAEITNFHGSIYEICYAAMEVEVAFGAHGVFPLPMGMEREDRCE